MLLRRITLENVRSFLDRQEIAFEGPLAILIGPNGGGKTNLLDAIQLMLRRYLFATRYLQPIHGPGKPRYSLNTNDQLGQMILDPHSAGAGRDQVIEVIVEVSQDDLDNMTRMKSEAGSLYFDISKTRELIQDPWAAVSSWNLDAVHASERFTYVWKNGSLLPPSDEKSRHFLEYLQLYEFDNSMRAETGRDALKVSMIYLPVNRASSGFSSTVSLANYNDTDVKRSVDATSSRSGGSIVNLAVGRLALKYRLLLEHNNQSARTAFLGDPNVKSLSAALKRLGYEWDLVTTNALTNEYDISLRKQGSSFLVQAASSGEKELLTYLFAVYALNVRNTIIVVDEPELHLHPRWQIALYDLFVELSEATGNQFIFATHSPTFITPRSIQNVSRVFSRDQKSHVLRLDTTNLPNSRHLFNLVNSQNNEVVFFANKVVLVEGISDRIFFRRVFDLYWKMAGKIGPNDIEIVSVGGKGFFASYVSLLTSCSVDHVIIADNDYLEQVGEASIKSLFSLNQREIKQDVVDNLKSSDGTALVRAIEEALEAGTWDAARDTWKYIKSRRVHLKAELTAAEQADIDQFISQKQRDGLHILRRGALEDYLPTGFAGKDLGKLIDFVSSDEFWSDLEQGPKDELIQISGSVLGIAAQV